MSRLSPHALKRVLGTLLSGKPFWVILAGTSITLSFLLGLLLFNLRTELEQQRRELREGMTWHITQLQREGLLFIHSLHNYKAVPSEQGIEEVKLTLDIFWSRVHTLDSGEVGVFFRNIAGADDAFDEMKNVLRRLDVLVASIVDDPQADNGEIVEITMSALTEMHKVAVSTSTEVLRLSEGKRDRFHGLYSRAIWLLVGATVATFVLVALLLRQRKALDALARGLEYRVERQSADLRSSRQKVQVLSQAVEQSPASVVICNGKGEIEYVNAQFEQTSGYRAEEVIGHNPGILRSDETPSEIYDEMWRALRKGQQWHGELCNKKKSGERYWELVSISPIVDEDSGVTRYLAIQEDITQRKMYEERLLHMANYDELTQLPNRLLAMDRLEQVLKRGERNGELTGLLFIDLDNFKQINDTLGHDGGDQLLKNAALRLASCMRSCDTAARFGGDEFIVILSDLKEKAAALNIVERIVTAFAKPFEIQGISVSTTTSIGVCFAPDDGTDPPTLLKNADSAMYAAKESGKMGYRVYDGG